METKSWLESLPEPVRAVAEKFPIGSKFGAVYSDNDKILVVVGYRVMSDGLVRVWVREESWIHGIRIDLRPESLGPVKPKPTDFFPPTTVSEIAAQLKERQVEERLPASMCSPDDPSAELQP